jgi:hypothetical protein
LGLAERRPQCLTPTLALQLRYLLVEGTTGDFSPARVIHI